MSRVVLKERVFTPVGRTLGTFSAVDLESFDLQYTDSDEPSKQGGGQQQSEKRRVPDPKDNNKLSPIDEPENRGSQGGSDSLANQGDEEDKGRYQKPDEYDRYGEDIDSEDWDNPNNKKEDTEGGGFGSSEDDGSQEQGSSGNEQGEDSGDTSSNGQDGGSDSGSESEGGETDGGQMSSSDGDTKGNFSNGSGESGNSGGGDTLQEEDGSDSQNGQSGDDEQEGQEGSDNGGSSGQGSSSGSSSQRSDEKSTGGMGNSSRNFWDDLDEDDFGEGTDEPSELDKAIDKMNKSQTGSEKKMREAEKSLEKAEQEQEKDLTESEKRDKLNKAKDTISQAAQSSRNLDSGDSDDENSRRNSRYDDDDDENDVLSKLGAGELTSLVQNKMKSGWKKILEKLLDNALGIDIIHNPNLINKKIEDAPPGREDDTSKLANIVVLVDCSPSMGSHKFKQVVAHIDTMVSAKRLGDVRFHIMGWNSMSKNEVLATYKKVKGRQFSKTVLANYNKTGGGTYIEHAIEAAMEKVKKPDAIMIFTDGEIYDSHNLREKNKVVDRFFRVFKKRIIWVLTADANVNDRLKAIDPYSIAHKQYIKFKKG